MNLNDPLRALSVGLIQRQNSNTSIGGLFNGIPLDPNKYAYSFTQLAASLAVGFLIFVIQFGAFNLFRTRLKRIYYPKTFMVPERERVPEPRGGLFGWFLSIFKTSNSEFISKCGLDAYFYLRYLRMLLKLFIPIAIIFIPVLMTVNHVGIDDPTSRGVDQYAIGNIPPTHTNRLWAHLVAAVSLVVYFGWLAYSELRGFIRVRQAYLTSPQHRIRASATTVLVTNIPRTWLSKEALDELYDVFPGGVRNIWINRNYDELDSLVSTRDSIANHLEFLYTNLLSKAQRKYIDQKKKAPAQAQPVSEDQVDRPGRSVGNPHQIAKNLDEALGRRNDGDCSSDSDSSDSDHSDDETGARKKRGLIPGVVVGGLDAVGQGIGAVGHGMGKVGKFMLGKGRRDSQERLEMADEGEEQQRAPSPPRPSTHTDGTTDERSSQASPQLIYGAGLSSTFPSDANHNSDEIPLRDLKVSADQPSQESAPTPLATAPQETPSTETKSGPGQWFQNSLLEDMPTVPQIIKMTQAATARRQRILRESKLVWSQWLPEKERETTCIHSSPWINWIPYTGTRLDAIDYNTVLLGLYNEHIERFQQDPDRFPLMSSAFIQFNHQVAAHMACQALNHHMPLQMAPRTIEISPHDVVWGNLSISWWMRYLRTALVLALVIGLMILWAPMIAFTTVLGQLDSLAELFPAFAFLSGWPSLAKNFIQGVLPPLLLSILLLVLPMLFRLLSYLGGATTGKSAEMSVQNYFFTFLFIQVFLIITISGSILKILDQISKDFTSTPSILAKNLPKTSGYFMSYIILQALSVSAGALLQIGTLFMNYIWAKMVDGSPRSLFSRATSLPEIMWGSFFPIYTNLAVIGVVYSVLSPLILVFNIGTFVLFWVAHRYNALYVNRFTNNDTGGLLFPRAVNQLFIGIYTMQLCLIGLFFLQRDENNKVACVPQAIIMIVTMVLTIGYQVLLNRAFNPLLTYMPITLEDDAVRRDEEFAALQAQRFDAGDPQDDSYKLAEGEKHGDNLQTLLKEKEDREREESQRIEDEERQRIESKRVNRSTSQIRGTSNVRGTSHVRGGTESGQQPARESSTGRPSASRRQSSQSVFGKSSNPYRKHHSIMFDRPEGANAKFHMPHSKRHSHARPSAVQVIKNAVAGETPDVEKQEPQFEDRFFIGIHDELEDLTQDERDVLVDKAFKHRALRATRPAIWIPKDAAGVSEFELSIIADDPVFRKFIWISDEGAYMDDKGKVNESKLMRPPDFNEEQLVTL